MKKLPEIQPVNRDNLREFCEFLYNHLSKERSVDQWQESFLPPWKFTSPNYGFMIRDEDQNIVGGIGAIYSEQNIAGKTEQFCNITSWCVIEAYRSQSMRLAMALTQQKGYTITDFSPTQVVSDTLKFLKFKPMDERISVFPNIPLLGLLNSGVSVLDKPQDIAESLDAVDLEIYRDHLDFPWLRHVVLCKGESRCHIIYKKQKLKNLPAVKIIYLSNPQLFGDYQDSVSNHLLLKKGALATLIENRFLTKKPRICKVLSGYIQKNYYSENLQESDINYIYSEQVCMDLT